jgi:phospholipid/cholesterol/gamma-HCH transport system substrate-binding protein
MGDQSKNVLIGIFVIAALSVITFVILFLHPKVGDEGHLLRVRFADIDKIPVGTRVLFAGKPVGEVVAITEIDQVADERQGHEGKVFLYQLDLRVDSSVNV